MQSVRGFPPERRFLRANCPQMGLRVPLRILGSRVDPVDMDAATQRIAQLLAQQRFAQVVTFGSEMAR